MFTRQQALSYLGSRVRTKQSFTGPKAQQKRPLWEDAMEALATIVLAHVAVKNMDLRPKGIYLGIMAKRVLMAMKDEKMVDDRDYVGNKRLELYVYHAISSIFNFFFSADGTPGQQRRTASLSPIRGFVQDL